VDRIGSNRIDGKPRSIRTIERYERSIDTNEPIRSVRTVRTVERTVEKKPEKKHRCETAIDTFRSIGIFTRRTHRSMKVPIRSDQKKTRGNREGKNASTWMRRRRETTTRDDDDDGRRDGEVLRRHRQGGERCVDRATDRSFEANRSISRFDDDDVPLDARVRFDLI